jgi:hypothetical protein
MRQSERQTLLSSLAAAQARVAELYGEYSAAPVVIAGHTMEVMETYGGNSYNRAGRTYVTPVATFVVLGPGGCQSEDVLAHELAHAELAARIGYWRRKAVPNWFDEGLAVQVDDRYSGAEWRSGTEDGRLAPDLDEMGTIKHNDWLGYAMAKHHVGRWLDAVGQEGLRALLLALASGADFEHAFHSGQSPGETAQRKP